MSAAAPVLSSPFPNATLTHDGRKGTKAVLSAFGLQGCAEAFAKALYDTGAFISGGSALYWYLNNYAETPIPVSEGSDMDIWLPAYRAAGGYIDTICERRFVKVSLSLFECLLKPLGYKRQSEEERSAEIEKRRALERAGKVSDEICYHRSPSLQFIKGIYNFINTDLNRKIQIIVTENHPNIRKEILRSFDFDICGMCVEPYMGTDARFAVTSCVPKPTFAKPIPNTFHLGDVTKFNFTNVMVRLEKYYSRGFVLEVDAPACTACGCMCKSGPVTLSLVAAKAYVQGKMAEHLAKGKTAPTPARRIVEDVYEDEDDDD